MWTRLCGAPFRACVTLIRFTWHVEARGDAGVCAGMVDARRRLAGEVVALLSPARGVAT